MLNKYHFFSFLTAHFIGFISGVTVTIDIQPKSIYLGQDLKVTCHIRGDVSNNDIKTFLKCPFNNGKETFCIKNCETTDICTSSKCNYQSVGQQSFQCISKKASDSLQYSYTFLAISNTVVKNRTELQFTCTYTDQTAVGTVMITESPDQIYSSKDFTIATSTTSSIFSTKTNAAIEPGKLRTRDFILIGLVGGLLISFLINIWCSVQWCIRKCRNKTSKTYSNVPYEQNSNYNSNDPNHLLNENEINSDYYHTDNIKRAKSQPTLSNNDRNNPRYIPNPSSTSSNNYQPKYRISNPNMDEIDLNNGSIHSLLNSNSLYGPMMFAPVQYLDQSMLPYIANLPQSPYNQHLQMQMRFPMDSNGSQNNMNILNEQDNPNRPRASLHHPLPKKPDEMMSDQDSVLG